MIKEAIKEALETIDLQTLKYLSAVRVAISVCESENVLNMIRTFYRTAGNEKAIGISDGQWIKLRGKVKRTLNEIGVPGQIIDLVLENLWPISFQIFKWILNHVEDTGINYSANFCWTPHANIYYRKTAVLLSKNEAINIKKRFRLACLYCLDSEIRALWDQMNLSERRFFYVRKDLKKPNQNPIVLYWTYYIQDVPNDFWDRNALNHAQIFKFAAQNGYLSATKYFLGKMKAQLRNRMISNCFFIYFQASLESNCPSKEQLATASFLISKIRLNTPGIYLGRGLSLVFLYFLEWPMQKRFLTVTNRLKSYLWRDICAELLKRIFEKDLAGFKDYDYKELFKDFWLQMPENFKTFVNSISSVGFKIFTVFVKKHFGFVFKESSFVLKAKFRAIVFEQEILENVAEKENVEFFKFLVRERVTSKTYLIDRYSLRGVRTFLLEDFEISFFNLPLGELMFLMDGISKSSSHS